MQKKRPIYIPFAGPALLEAPLLNKGSAFTERERQQFNLEGLLPYNIETIEEQKARSYQQLCAFSDAMDKHIYLRNIQDINETLYFRLVSEHLTEIMPLIYTPTVGAACQQFSKIYRRKRGLFISYPDRERIDDMLQNATKQTVKVMVVTDGERILGLGDQGIGGMGIPIGKLALYTACGGISPAYTLPVTLDVGTNNEALLADPMYMGWRHKRIGNDEYYAFVDEFIEAVKRRWPDVLLQFEDFSGVHATPLLQRYRNDLCCFNDDIQGTASVTLAALLAGVKRKGETLAQQRVVFAGAGSAGCGIASYVVKQMMSEGLSKADAQARVLLCDADGLLTADVARLLDFQRDFAQPTTVLESYGMKTNGLGAAPSLAKVVEAVKPTILIGVSGQAGVFTQSLIESMFACCPNPIVLPLSNPTSQVEALPSDILRWTQGRALVATGSPFAPVQVEGRNLVISQCNNSYIFPGIGLAVITARITRITDGMLMAASGALADLAEGYRLEDGILPPLDAITHVSKRVAAAVVRQAIADGVADPIAEELIAERFEANFWKPEYREYRRTSF